MKDWFQGLSADLKTPKARKQREKLRKLVFVAVTVLATLALAFFAGRATASDVFKSENAQGPVVLRLSESPCTDKKVRAALYAKILDDRRFKAATLTYAGKDWRSCYVEVDGNVLSIDEEGAPFQPVPRHLFKDDSI